LSKKTQLTFSAHYNKLTQPVYKTVRWLDAEYRLGKVYEAILVEKGKIGINRYHLGWARITNLELKPFNAFTDDFCRYDTATPNFCGYDREGYLNLLAGWYSKKPDWQAEKSELQVLTCESCVMDSRVVKATAPLLCQRRL
jgi:hypothetical protein